MHVASSACGSVATTGARRTCRLIDIRTVIDRSQPANAAGTSDALFPIIAAVVIVAALGGYLFMRRRPAQP